VLGPDAGCGRPRQKRNHRSEGEQRQEHPCEPLESSSKIRVEHRGQCRCRHHANKRESFAPRRDSRPFALVDGLMHNWTMAPGQFDLGRVGQVAVQSYIAGLRA
jgi:hypothetical protein